MVGELDRSPTHDIPPAGDSGHGRWEKAGRPSPGPARRIHASSHPSDVVPASTDHVPGRSDDGPDDGSPAAPAGTLARAVAWPVRMLVVWPARLVAVAVFLPLRLAYELLRVAGRAAGRLLLALRALGRWIIVGAARLLWVWLLTPVGRALAWIWRQVLHPLLRLLRIALWENVLVLTVRLLWIWLFKPVGRTLALLARWCASAIRGLVHHLLVRPVHWIYHALVLACWRKVIVPAAHAVRVVIGWAARATLAVLRILVVPVTWCWRTTVVPTARTVRAVFRTVVVTPCRWISRSVWHPVRQAISDVSRALKGKQPVR